MDLRLVDLHVVEQAELDDVHPKLRILDGAKRLDHVVSCHGASGYRGRPSSGSSSHGARDSTNEWYCGRLPGSPSSEPSRTETSSPSGQWPPKREEPHAEQNTLTAVPS